MTPAAPVRDPTPNDPFNLGVSLSAAQILLDRYQRLMAHANPFVILPADATAESLHAKKPFLLHAIVSKCPSLLSGRRFIVVNLATFSHMSLT